MPKPFTFLLVACLCLGLLRTSDGYAGQAFPDPPGGWTYIYNGDKLMVGDVNSGFTSLDGTWSHDNGSDQWDGSTIGGTFTTNGVFGVDNAPVGASLITEGGATHLRMQDTGDPRDYGYPDPGNRKIYFGHDVEADGGGADV